ncbi:hypothetical protein PCIT_a2533 [Pseudoalteromonas citrea]|uniref:DUF2169 domain-containing protein n=2 Tax=Pseudoalteromonas citrea TaxID=43655 RepID=A0AAD4AH69_9GAMM|nr:DUF2169 domain-containing protein [Pseudoalteromonas citrea]KAF7769663.1 hypothetical protein PCIT_a2533 [Pseudoalteromonas citrea]
MIHNQTAWQVETFDGWTQTNEAATFIVLKQSFEFDNTGAYSEKIPSLPLVAADEYVAEPATSSLRQACELVPFKQGFEVYGVLKSYLPAHKQARVLEVELALSTEHAPLFNKRLRVTGARYWQRTLFGPVASEPQPLSTLTLDYGVTFGGYRKDKATQCLLENPAGRGYKLKNKQSYNQALVQVEYANTVQRKPSQSAPVASFGPIPSHWAPRVQYVPQVDQAALLASEYPFSEPQPAQLYNYAPLDQRVLAKYAANWQLKLTGLCAQLPYGEQVTLHLPYTTPNVVLHTGLNRYPLTLCCDTLVLDTDEQSFSLIWRAAIDKHSLGVNSQVWVTDPHGEEKS